MDSPESHHENPTKRPSLLWLAGLIPPLLGLHVGLKPRSNSNSQKGFRWLLVLATIATLSLTWVNVASHYVPEPYLDEVFHIPQAQRYGLGKYLEWDDKLTTPPGLYVYSLLMFLISGAKSKFTTLTPHDLRATNAVALLILCYLSLLCRLELTHLLNRNTTRKGLTPYTLHTALNICLFPLLFFFSGLYYTDVISTAAVLASFLNHLRRAGKVADGGAPGFLNDLGTLLLGVGTLFMRQTNVFWTVVFMGGLEAVQAVKTLKHESVGEDEQSDGTLIGDVKFFIWRSSAGDVHDVPLSRAWVEDWLATAVSLLIAGLCNPFRVLRAIWPYIAVLISFVGFVAWNGGVVLGDKTNHVATIHLAQMLYIWPFFAFFSLPLLLPHLVTLLDKAWAVLNSGRQEASHGLPPAASVPTRSKLLAAIYLLGTLLISLAIVRFNTIIHPFTLADNRHYMFYVFRYTIRRATWIRYALVVAYTISRWLVWGVFSGSAGETSVPSRADEKQPTTSQEDRTFVPTSAAIIFLLATTLSLITAPLVEPRYFIIPWVIWRLLVPAWHLPKGAEHGMIEAADKSNNIVIRGVVQYAREIDSRLVLETAWFVLVNLVTIGIFLLKPYQWRAEDGTLLDEGRLQRFMW